MAGHLVPITWDGRRAQAWRPDEVGDLEPKLTVDLARRTERAAATIVRADALLPATSEPLVRILLRAEGIASSNIEGLAAPLDEVAVAELDPAATSTTAGWIADNIAVLTDAIEAPDEPLTIAQLHGWHRRLMVHGSLPDDLVGAFRDRQGWIGGTSPIDAVYVPPPPELLDHLVEDLLALANRDDGSIDAITQAAIVHAQFETIHPYGDGNGRLGRVLISWVLARRLGVVVPPPVSVLIARDPGGYLSSLHLFRESSPDPLISWFSDLADRAGEASLVLAEGVRSLLADWKSRLTGLRADASARSLADELPAHPVLSTSIAAALIGGSERSARTAAAVLVDRGVLRPIDLRRSTGGRPQTWWAARELLDLVQEWPGRR